MQIDSGHNGYPYPTRPRTIERATEEPAQREVEQPRRSGTTLTGADTFLSSSLAKALWGLDDSTSRNASVSQTSNSAGDIAAKPLDWVADLYMEFSENG
jgi:hypothetical protein